jgi:hypothetical protein
MTKRKDADLFAQRFLLFGWASDELLIECDKTKGRNCLLQQSERATLTDMRKANRMMRSHGIPHKAIRTSNEWFAWTMSLSVLELGQRTRHPSLDVIMAL